jgi:hypothetical protein
MKRKVFSATLILGLVMAAACASSGERDGNGGARQSSKQTEKATAPQNDKATAPSSATELREAQTPAAMHDHGAQAVAADMPAFITTAADLKSLKPTLAPETFTGKQRLGYQAAKEIPRTLAQLPCYCHCDRGFGHKSLQSCFVDDHAAHCSICIDEAVVAYQLEKRDGLKPEQIRERIVAQFSN